jgi:hypothetical protein
LLHSKSSAVGHKVSFDLQQLARADHKARSALLLTHDNKPNKATLITFLRVLNFVVPLEAQQHNSTTGEIPLKAPAVQHILATSRYNC